MKTLRKLGVKYCLSDAANRLEGQPMFKVLAWVQELERQGRRIIHFEIGDPDFATPGNIVNAAVESLRRGETHYTSSMGMHDFHLTICGTTERTRGFRPDLNQILVAPGANILIYYAISCLVNPGDEVIVPDPGFPTYYSAMKFCNVKAVPVPLRESNQFRMNPDDVRERITNRTRLIIINSPQNPTGALMTPDEITELARLAEKHDIYLYSDEIYVRMIFDETVAFKSPSFLDHCRKRTIVANGFSKSFAMTGWRLGVAIGPADVIAKMGLLLQTTSSCVPAFVQRAGIEAVSGDQREVLNMLNEYRERRDLIVEGLNSIRGLSCLLPGGAFYAFPNITKTGMSSEGFARAMLDKAGVALLPGNCFGSHGEGYVRLCYANSKENIIEGLHRIKSALED